MPAKTDYRKFPPVKEKVKRPKRASQTLLSHMEKCPRSAFLYLKHGEGGPQSHALARGEVFHDFAEKATQMLAEKGEEQMPPEVAKDIAQEVMRERTDLILTEAEQDAVRIMAWHWAIGTVLDLEALASIEDTFQLKIGKWTVSGRLDRVEVVSSDAHIRDYKTSLYVPPQEDFEHNFQLLCYALLFAEGAPEDGLPMGGGIGTFHLYNHFPRHEPRPETGLVSRYTSRDAAEVHDFRRVLEGLLERLEAGFTKGEWPAVPGSHCSICPCAEECPVPEKLREVKTIKTLKQASEVAEDWMFTEQRAKRLKKSVQEFAKENDLAVPIGSDLELSFSYSESRSPKDLDALVFAARQAAATGEMFDPEEHIKTRKSARFGKRKRWEPDDVKA